VFSALTALLCKRNKHNRVTEELQLLGYSPLKVRVTFLKNMSLPASGQKIRHQEESSAWHDMPENRNLHNNHCDNLKPYKTQQC
jgi:hypothetical protein